MRCKLLHRWWKRKDGAAAIEFALLAIPYLTLSLGIIELSLIYASASMMEGATSHAARMIRTGQVQQSSEDPEALFRDELCNYATVLINCEDIVVEVVRMDSYFDYADLSAQYDEDGNMTSSGFDAGGASDRVLVRTGYSYRMLTPLVGPLLSGEDGRQTFVSTIVLQTEPYEFGG